MSPIQIALTVFGCLLSGTLFGMFLQTVIPEHHFSEASKDTVKIGMGFIGTITALVLGLVIASSQASYSAQDAAVRHTAVKIMLLDHVLVQYGAETMEMRDRIRRTLARKVNQIWPEERSQTEKLDASETAPLPEREDLECMIQHLGPQNDAQRSLQSQALQIGNDIMEMRWLTLSGSDRSFQTPFLIIVAFWLTVIFGSFGLFAPRNATVLTVLVICALSAAGAIFLILEMDQPFSGIMKVSSAPLRYALSHLGR